MGEVGSMEPLVQMRDVWTFEDVEALDVQDWWRYEIVDGALVVSPSTGGDHEWASAEVRAALWSATPPRLIVVGPMGVRIGSSYLVPDLVVADRGRVRGRQTLDPADVLLAVEIVSPGSSTMDRVTKPAKYAAAGITHYWRIETDPLEVAAYVVPPGATVYAECGRWFAGEVIRLDRPFPIEFPVDGLLDG